MTLSAQEREVQAPERVDRHTFGKDIQAELATLRKLDNWHGLAALVTDWAIILAVGWFSESLPGALRWLFYTLVALPIIGTRQRALATLLHEAAHGTLAKNARLNKFIGTIPSAHLILQTYKAYYRSHLRDHHGAFGDPEVDPDLRAHIVAGLYRSRTGTSFAWRYLISPLFGFRTPRLMRELISARLSGARDELRGGIGVTLYLTAIGAAFFAAGHGHLFIMYWAIPLFIVFPLVNWYIELLEHFPMVGNESVDIATTRPRAVGPVSRHFFGIHAEGYHLDHHLSPKIPFWNLHKAHIVRLRDPEYRAVVERNKPAGKGLLWQFRDMIDRVDKNELNTRIGDLSLKK